jgi:hypothetical protein
MASIQLKKLTALLMIALLNIIPAAENTFLTAEERNMTLHIQTIAHQYINHGRSTVVSMS